MTKERYSDSNLRYYRICVIIIWIWMCFIIHIIFYMDLTFYQKVL